MTSRLRSALLTGAVVATLALGAAPAQADNQQDPAGLPAAEQTAPGPAADLGPLEETVQEAAPAIEAAPATEIVPVEPIDALVPVPVPVPVPGEAEEVLADALIPVLVEETETNDDGGAPAGEVEEWVEDIDGVDGEVVDAPEDGADDAPDSGVGEEPGTGTDPAPGTGSEPAPGTPVVQPGTPAAPTPSTPQAPVPAGFEPIVVGGRTLTHADFNIPDDIAASDEETIARWMEENIDKVLESEGMIYIVDLMVGYLEAGDREGLEALIRELGASDPAAAEDILRELDALFLWFEEWPDSFGEDPIYVGAPSPYEITPGVTAAPAVQPASVKAIAQSAPAAVGTAAAPVAAPAGQLAETGATGTVWLVSGGAGLLLLGAALVALRRRMV